MLRIGWCRLEAHRGSAQLRRLATSTMRRGGVRARLGASTVYYLYDLGGKEVAEVSSAGLWNRGEVYAGSRHLATYSGGSAGVTYFTTADWLGTERMRTGLSGPIVESCTSLPFGDAQTCTGSEVSPMHFTGQHFDSESFLSHMDFRSLSATQGRWTSMDPARVAAANPANPQSWNLYAYVLNNPVRLIDPSGLEPQGQTGGGSGGSGPGCNDPNSLVFCFTPSTPPVPSDRYPYKGPGFGGSPQAFLFAGNNSVTSQLKAVANSVGKAWLRGMDAIGRASDWANAHLLITLPVAALAALEGNEGPIEEDAGIIEDELSVATSETTYLYQKVGAAGEHLKFGITNNPVTRYTAAELNGGRLRIIAQGARSLMLSLERNLHETLPIGPEERQMFYIQMQIEKGLQPPPY